MLAADKDTEFGIRGILGRPAEIPMRPIVFRTFTHPNHDPGCLREGAAFLRSLLCEHSHALVVFDREGCGRESDTRDELEKRVEAELSVNGWEDRGAAVTIDPELESWVFVRSSRLHAILGWENRQPGLISHLESRGLWEAGNPKPSRPKSAMEEALYEARKPRSAAIYGRLASELRFEGCLDPAFGKLRRVLSSWFPRIGDAT